MHNAVPIPSVGDPDVWKRFNLFLMSVLAERDFLDELALLVWSSYKKYGRGLFIRKFEALPVGNYFDETKQSGHIAGYYLDSSFFSKEDLEFKKEIDEVLSGYDPQKEFVLAGIAFVKNMPYFNSLAITYPDYLVKEFQTQPTKLSRTQIRKRLRRMVQARQKMVILDANNPEIGDNLQVWLEEAKKLPLSVVIESATGEQVSQLPENLQNQVLTLECK